MYYALDHEKTDFSPSSFSFLISFITNLYINTHRRLDRLPAHGALLHDPLLIRARDAVRAQDVAARYQPVWESKFYGAFVQILRVVLHAIDATPARSMAWRCRFLTARPSQDGRVIAEK